MEADFIKLVRAKGERVLDRDGNQIGQVSQVATEPETLSPRWLVVRTSAVGRSRLVPIDGAVDDGEVLRSRSPLRSPTAPHSTSTTTERRDSLYS